MTNNKRYALLSVYDKTNIVAFAEQLIKLQYTIISTGGTGKTLTENKIPFTPIQEITGNPESFDGRMKTISFQIEGGILFDRTNKKHTKEAQTLKVPAIDIVVCNLYPFEATISKKSVKLDDAIENIDVGGPTMIRAAAKNFKNVLVAVDPNDYHQVINFLNNCHPELVSGSKKTKKEMLKQVQNDTSPILFRQTLAAKAFSHLSFYDSLIADYLSIETFTQTRTLPLRKTMDLRYGENPHQKAAVYMFPLTTSPFTNLQKQWGRELSHVNITDINAGLESVQLFTEPVAVIIKHNCPCGIALGKTPSQALERAIAADPESAFGGIIVMNQPMDLKSAKEIGKFKDENKSNIDIVAVPEITKDALEYLSKVRKSMGIYTFGKLNGYSDTEHIKQISGGVVIQTPDTDIDASFKEWKVVTKKKPTKKQLDQMKIAWKFISRIKSNAIIVVDKELPMTRGIGTGQTSRVRSTKIALSQAGKLAKDAILASDSFFPFEDSVMLAKKAGITTIIQQGGSINDQKSIDAADKADIVMVFTGRRAFWH
ncbi:MAG: bifunctional phosphoribosylaminoimidazolecarboxamide formyltransferase/IMP cyclohydrolase [Candidatus Levybacteria bacterium]|nr:bifunctional phosphoribosylaminoimidazolecarboxamide formyltransferase/IMP cyclohydrolase [Candidatus Levybacteria bacterium]